MLYEIYCLRDMPPATAEEQAMCFQKRTHCWRTGELLSKMDPNAQRRQKTCHRG